MVDFDTVVADCLAAADEGDLRTAIREVLERSLANGPHSDTLNQAPAGFTVLHHTPQLTILNVVWPPLFTLSPHDHRMWAAIGVYGGSEDNAFFRRDADTIVSSGGKQIHEGDVLILGDDTIHSVHNPSRAYTGAIHVYGGDFINTPRSQWDAETLEEGPYDFETVRQEFLRAGEAADRAP